MNVGKDLNKFFSDEPPGQKVNSLRWLQKLVMKKALTLPREFDTLGHWEDFRDKLRMDLPKVCGFPDLPPMKESFVRGRIRVGDDVLCERVDVYVDENFSAPVFVFLPEQKPSKPMPALVWNPGWPQDKWTRSYQEFGVRMARQGYVVLVVDHPPFGETSPAAGEDGKQLFNMTLVMGMSNTVGISYMMLRCAIAMRCGEYLRSRPDVDDSRVAIGGLCEGGMDTYLVAAIDDTFCAAAPVAAATTLAIHFAEMGSYHANADASPFPFGILNVCDIEHLHAAIAPRPLLVRANLPDLWWPVSGFDDVEHFTRKIYRLYDAEDKIDFGSDVHEHDLTGPYADALEAFMKKYV